MSLSKYLTRDEVLKEALEAVSKEMQMVAEMIRELNVEGLNLRTIGGRIEERHNPVLGPLLELREKLTVKKFDITMEIRNKFQLKKDSYIVYVVRKQHPIGTHGQVFWTDRVRCGFVQLDPETMKPLGTEAKWASCCNVDVLIDVEVQQP